MWESLLSNMNLGQGIKMFFENELSMTIFRDFTIDFVRFVFQKHWMPPGVGDTDGHLRASIAEKNAGLRHVSPS